MKEAWLSFCAFIGVPPPRRLSLTAELERVNCDLENAECEALYWTEWSATLRLRKSHIEAALRNAPKAK